MVRQQMEKSLQHVYGTVLALETSTQGIKMKKSTIFLPNASVGLFTFENIKKGQVVEHYKDCLLYVNLSKKR